MKNLSLDKIKIFIAVAEQGSLSAAGRSLGKPQSAISEALSTLEGQLGYRLFERTLKKTEITAHGEGLLGDARAILAASDAFEAKAANFQNGVEAHLAFTMDMLFPHDVTLAAITDFGSEFPNTAISVSTEALGAAVQPLIDGKNSFAVIGSLPQAPAGLVTERIRIVDMCLVASPDFPLSALAGPVPLARLKEYRQIITSDKTDLSAGRSFGVFSSVTWSATDLATKKEFIKSGFGWGFMPRHAVRSELESGELTQITTSEQNHRDGWLPVALFVAYRRNRPPGRAARWMIERLREGAGDLSTGIIYSG